jgi:uncharacterized protein (DUF362 family)
MVSRDPASSDELPDPRLVTVAVTDEATYPDDPPFSPSEEFPEYRYEDTSNTKNYAYKAVRECFRQADLDEENYGTDAWNPLGDLVDPGQKVMLKPNFVKEEHPRDPDGWRYVLTHGSIIRAVADYVFKAVGKDGYVVLADGPQTDSSFHEICNVLGMYDIQDYYARHDLDFRLVDLRQEEWESKDGVVVDRKKLEGDPKGYVEYDLAEHSEFTTHHGSGSYYGADYDSEVVNYHHSDGRHEYLISGSAVDVDVMFSLPKLKSHKKAGITVSLKNLVGINGDKNYLPHHTEAGEHCAGDEHPDPDPKHQLERSVLPYFRKLALRVPFLGPRLFMLARKVGKRIFGATEDVIRSGNWWGNDTVWRMCLDLNKLLFYGNTDGTLRDDAPDSRKRHYSLVDGIIAGEGRGPMNPDPKYAGVVVFGTHPASVDAACARIMGFDPDRIPIVRQAFRCKSYAIAEWGWHDVRLKSATDTWNGRLDALPMEASLDFRPHFGWVGHVELDHRSPES